MGDTGRGAKPGKLKHCAHKGEPKHGHGIGPIGRDDVCHFTPSSSPLAAVCSAFLRRPSQLDRLADDEAAFQEYIMTLEPVLVAMRQTSELEERQRVVEGTPLARSPCKLHLALQLAR